MPEYSIHYLSVALTLLAATPCSSTDGTRPQPPQIVASDFLKFETVLDGRCYNLSAGGKLVLLRNTHASKPIDYRLVRVFANTAQGLSTGVLDADHAPQKLGCDKVDGRAQTWRIQRARFVEE